jgi:hypothetical protein
MISRHATLDDASKSTIVAFVLVLFRVGKAVTPKELRTRVQTNHNSRLTRRWVSAFIDRHLDQFQPCRPLRQEGTPLIIPRVHVEAHIAPIHAHISGKFSELVFNLDEIGSFDQEDRKPRKVVAQ